MSDSSSHPDAGRGGVQPVRVVSTGFEADGLCVPPFELRAGEYLCLHLPAADGTLDEHSLLVRLLTGYATVPGLRVLGQSEWARPIAALDRWVSTARPPEKAADWLAGVTRLGREQAARRLWAHGLPAEALARNLTPPEWRLMSLEVAWARGAEVVVFETGDCEPGGVGRINRAVDVRIDRCAAVRLNRPVVVEGKPEWRACWPRGRCLGVDEAIAEK
jgi:hypothetical protein